MPKQRGRLGSILGPTAEEMAKKDDDLMRRPAAMPSWTPSRIAPRRSVRRLVLLLAFLAIAYATYSLLQPTTEFRDYVPNFPKYEYPAPAPFDRVWPPSQPRPEKTRDELAEVAAGVSRDGRTSLSLPALPATLKEIEAAPGDRDKWDNANVLFASSSPRSAAALLPLACEMGRQGRNRVHYAVMSRNDMSIQDLKKIHSIDSSCGVTIHGMPASPQCMPMNVNSNGNLRCSPGLCLRVHRCALTGSY